MTKAAYFHSTDDFVHQLGPLVLVGHLLELVLPGHLCHDRVDGDGQHHDGHAGKDGGAQLLVHEVAAKGDLQRGGPVEEDTA